VLDPPSTRLAHDYAGTHVVAACEPNELRQRDQAAEIGPRAAHQQRSLLPMFGEKRAWREAIEQLLTIRRLAHVQL